MAARASAGRVDRSALTIREDAHVAGDFGRIRHVSRPHLPLDVPISMFYSMMF
jgi:hypothetical protein